MLSFELKGVGRRWYHELRCRVRTGADFGGAGGDVLSLVRFSLKCLWEPPGETVSCKSETEGRRWD